MIDHALTSTANHAAQSILEVAVHFGLGGEVTVGVSGPPDLPSAEVTALRDLIDRMHDSAQWRAAVDLN